MKAGLVMNTFVLEALYRFGALCPLTDLYTADEEITSPSSRPIIEAEAKGGTRGVQFQARPGEQQPRLAATREPRLSNWR